MLYPTVMYYQNKEIKSAHYCPTVLALVHHAGLVWVGRF